MRNNVKQTHTHTHTFSQLQLTLLLLICDEVEASMQFVLKTKITQDNECYVIKSHLQA